MERNFALLFTFCPISKQTASLGQGEEYRIEIGFCIHKMKYGKLWIVSLGIKFDYRYQISVELGFPETIYVIHSYLHLVRLFWNQVFTWASVILRFLANVALSVEAKYFCLWNLFSSSQICNLEKEVRGFLRFGGVLFWYGWPIRLGVNGPVMHEESLIWDE